MVIDGREIVPDLARINFLERTLRTSRVIEPARELDVYSAVLGAIFVYPTDGLPQRVTLDWDLFDDQIGLVPAASVDQAGSLPIYLEPGDAVLEWQNFLTSPELPTLVDIHRPPTSLERAFGLLRWLLAPLCIGLAAVLLARGRRRELSWITSASAAVVVLALGIVGFWVGGGATLSEERSAEVVEGLLHNIYRAFDHRREERIYDTLDRSVSGALLERIYLETREGLELANQGGARAKVKSIELVEISARAGDDAGFVARTTWNVYGSVGHWGHVHQRNNRYTANLVIAPEAGSWKLFGLEILDEQRL